MPLKYHYSKHEDLDKLLDTKLGIAHKSKRYVLKSRSKSLQRKSAHSLFFDYTIVDKFDTLPEANEEALFQSSLAPRTEFFIVDTKTGLTVKYYLGGEKAMSPEERLRKAIFD